MDESPRAHFEAGCARGVLLYQWDPAAGRAVFYPRVLPGLQWRESAGAGTVYAATTIRPRGGEPRGIALIDLDEGFRMMSRVEGVAPQAVRIGLRVRVAWTGHDPPLPVFGPA
jgi:uncharacterized OB-fold protein